MSEQSDEHQAERLCPFQRVVTQGGNIMNLSIINPATIGATVALAMRNTKGRDYVGGEGD